MTLDDDLDRISEARNRDDMAPTSARSPPVSTGISPAAAPCSTAPPCATSDAVPAFAVLLDVMADHVHSPDIDRYQAALRGHAEYLRDRGLPNG